MYLCVYVKVSRICIPILQVEKAGELLSANAGIFHPGRPRLAVKLWQPSLSLFVPVDEAAGRVHKPAYPVAECIPIWLLQFPGVILHTALYFPILEK